MRALAIVSMILMVAGALNWGLVGLSGINAVEALLGTGPVASAIYVLVGLAGLHGILMLARLVSSRDDVCVPGTTRTATQS